MQRVCGGDDQAHGVTSAGGARSRDGSITCLFFGKRAHASSSAIKIALALVTINPAKQLRIDNRVGSLEAGKDADVVIWNHHPLSSYAIADRVYIDGQKYYDRLDDQKRLTELAKEKETLIAAERGERRNPSTTDGDGNGNGHGAAVGIAIDRGLASPPAQRLTTPTKGIVVITNARIFPIGKPPIDRGTIVIRDGIIASVGANVAVPAGAQQLIDAAGADVYPGFINARSTLGLADPGAGGFDDTDEILDFNPQLRPQVAFHNDSDSIPVARANGVTTAAVTPGGGLFGGQVAVMDLDGWTWEESTVKTAVGISFQFPAMSGGGRGGGRGGDAQQAQRTYQDLKKDRDARLDQVAHLLDEARAYAKAAGPNRRTDWKLDALVPVINKQIPLITRANTEQDIRDAVAFADRADVKIVISGGIEAPMVAPLLKDKNIPVILGSVLTLPSRPDLPHHASYSAAGELVKAGVKIAFATGDADNARQLPYQAAQSVAWGLSRDDALKALTINAADILGVADRVGSIEPGRIANLVISKGDPLEVRTTFTHVLIAGHDVGLDTKQLALYERYSKRP